MRPTSPKEIEGVLKLDDNARYRHMIKRIADAERAWGLWLDGWAAVGTNEGEKAFPLWPAREYAELCRDKEWSLYEVREIPLATLKQELLPRLQLEGTLIAAFPKPEGQVVTPTAEAMLHALRVELATWYAEYD